MDPTLESRFSEINGKLDLLLELRHDIKDHISADQRMFYGEAGQSGRGGDVITLKNSNRLYNQVITLIGTVLGGIVGDTLWKAFK